MLMSNLKTTGSRSYRNAFVIYHGLDISLMSCGVEICAINKNGRLTMKCGENELSVSDKRHLKTFCKRFEHRMS